MTLPELVKTLQKEFDKKIVTAKMTDRNYFSVDNSLDNNLENGKPLVWHNLKNLSQNGYATVLYSDNPNKIDAVRATVVDEINCLRITHSPNSSIQTGPISFRDIYNNIAPKYPIIVSGKPL